VKRPVVLLLGPSRAAISGVVTHVNSLLDSSLASRFQLEHFQVGSEGRNEGALARAVRLAVSPIALGLAVLRLDAGIVHLNTSLNARAWWRDLAYLAVAKLCGARVVMQVHGGALGRFSVSQHALGGFLRWALQRPDAVAVLSSIELEAWRRLAPGQNVVVLPNGIDCAPYGRLARAPRSAGDPLHLVYIGRLVGAKGIEETIEGLRLARSRGVDARLTLAGSGAEEARLIAQVRAAGLEDAVHFAGPTWGEDKLKLLGQSDVLCLASHSEGLPYALLEAMAAGVVPIVTRVGAIPDVVTEGVHGRFVPAGDPAAIADALSALAANRGALTTMSAACRKRVAAAYSIDRAVAGVAALYRSIRKDRWEPSQAG
jgi:glycosyltransferase involved in cell wall biosynthesis